MKILALDTSTHDVGIAWVDKSETQCRPILTTLRSEPTTGQSSLYDRLQRIACLRERLHVYCCQFRTQPQLMPDVLAYEEHTGRGYTVSDALSMALGAYLTVPALLGLPIRAINPNEAKLVYSRADQSRVKAKASAIAWAQKTYRLANCPTDAEADALAVAEACWKRIQAESQPQVVQMVLRPLARRKANG